MKKRSLFFLLFFACITVSVLATKPEMLTNGFSNEKKQEYLLRKTQYNNAMKADIKRKLLLAGQKKKKANRIFLVAKAMTISIVAVAWMNLPVE